MTVPPPPGGVPPGAPPAPPSSPPPPSSNQARPTGGSKGPGLAFIVGVAAFAALGMVGMALTDRPADPPTINTFAAQSIAVPDKIVQAVAAVAPEEVSAAPTGTFQQATATSVPTSTPTPVPATAVPVAAAPAATAPAVAAAATEVPFVAPTEVPVIAPTAVPAPVPTATVVVAAPAAAGCEPGYDPCIPLGTGDIDCLGGSGDGPRYSGPVTITGSDPYGLDGNDNDGRGCENS